ncbi:MAG: hypothetical protein ACRC6R_00575 [Bacteroidales bacterium]
MRMKRFATGQFLIILLAQLITSCAKTETISRIPDARVALQLNVDYHNLMEPLTGKSVTSLNGLNANSYLGYGGILVYYGFALDGGYNHYAFDLSCPVEVDPKVRVSIFESVKARCAKCGSVYDIQYGGGFPIEGKASQEGYYLRSYRTFLNGRELIISR